MIEESVFNESQIKEQIEKNYKIKINKIEKETRGSANIYYLYGQNQNKYVLKEFETSCNEKNVIKELNIIKHLKKYNINVAEYIQTINNQYYFKYKHKTIVLMKYINGYTQEPNSGNIKQTIESAQILGKIVKALEDYPYMEQETIKDWYNKSKIINGKQQLIQIQKSVINSNTIKLEIKQEIIKDIAKRLEIVKQLEKMDFEGMQYVTCKNSHGDFSIMQFIYKNGKVCAILDFAKARAFPISWEIIRSYSYIDKCCKDGDINIQNLQLYVRKVMEYITLNEYDLKFMPHVYLIQLVTSTFGYKQYLENNELTGLLKFAMWRTSMSQTLFNNISEISDSLINLK